MAKKTSQQLTVPPTAALSEPVAYDSRGKEIGLREEDRIYPMLTLVQKMSPNEHLQAAQPGEFINSLTLENYGDTVTFLPIIMRRQRVKWIDRKEGGGIDCRSFDGEQGQKYGSCFSCPHGKWKTAQEERDEAKRKPVCTEYWTFPILILKANADPEICVLSLGMTKYKAGKKLANLIHGKPGAPWTAKYMLKATEETSDFGDFFGVEVTGDGLLKSDDGLLLYGEQWYKMLHKDPLKTEAAE